MTIATDMLIKPEDPRFDREYIERVIRAWTDPVYRRRLSREELARLPDPPAGPIMDLIQPQATAVPWWTIIIATMLLTCGLCHTAPETCGHGGCKKAPDDGDGDTTTG